MDKRIVMTRTAIFGVALLLFGFLLPVWISPDDTGVLKTMQILQVRPTGNSFMILVCLLMIWNTIYALPHYLGAFLLGGEVGRQLRLPWLKTAVPLLLIPAISISSHLYNPLRFPFGIPEVLLLLTMVVLQKLARYQLSFQMKALVLTQLLLGFQWLSVIPFFPAEGFGNSPILRRVKEMAMTLGVDQALGIYSVMFCLILIVNATILSIFFTMSLQKWNDRKTLHLAQLEAIQSRSGREVLHLVHDLKTPLTAVEGLISLIEMISEDEKIRKYCQVSSCSIASMSEMISEMLYEDRKSWVSIEDIMNYVRASRLSGTSEHVAIEMPDEKDVRIWINKVHLTRAIVNLLDNAIDAIAGREGGRVVLQAQVNGQDVKLGVSDNGPGISPELLHTVWDVGYSTKSHAGLGLSFVRQVAESHGGLASIHSQVGGGTTVWIHMKGERAEDAGSDY